MRISNRSERRGNHATHGKKDQKWCVVYVVYVELLVGATAATTSDDILTYL